MGGRVGIPCAASRALSCSAISHPVLTRRVSDARSLNSIVLRAASLWVSLTTRSTVRQKAERLRGETEGALLGTDFEGDARFFFSVAGDGGVAPRRVPVILSAGKSVPATADITPGKVVFEVRNAGTCRRYSASYNFPMRRFGARRFVSDRKSVV